MKSSGRGNDSASVKGGAAAGSGDVDDRGAAAGGGTAPKGRPTPKRDAGSRRRGPVVPAPQTSAEARARRKAMAGPKPTKEQRRELKAQRRERSADRRERMLAGDDTVLLERDRGPIRRFARDVVDARINLLGLFMPSALVLLLATMAIPDPRVQPIVSLSMVVLMLAMIVDGVLVGRKVVKLVNQKFPANTENRFKLGMYAAGRASTVRRMRSPRPQVNRGAKVS